MFGWYSGEFRAGLVKLFGNYGTKSGCFFAIQGVESSAAGVSGILALD
jgi:hypothetical protein